MIAVEALIRQLVEQAGGVIDIADFACVNNGGPHSGCQPPLVMHQRVMVDDAAYPSGSIDRHGRSSDPLSLPRRADATAPKRWIEAFQECRLWTRRGSAGRDRRILAMRKRALPGWLGSLLHSIFV